MAPVHLPPALLPPPLLKTLGWARLGTGGVRFQLAPWSLWGSWECRGWLAVVGTQRKSRHQGDGVVGCPGLCSLPAQGQRFKAAKTVLQLTPGSLRPLWLSNSRISSVMEVPDGSNVGGPASSRSSGEPETDMGGCNSGGGWSSPSLPACCKEERVAKQEPRMLCSPNSQSLLLYMGEVKDPDPPPSYSTFEQGHMWPRLALNF